MYKIVFYAPEKDCEKVKEAMFSAGAGRIGDYERCAWQVKGEGQFCSKEGSNPHIGEQDKLERIEEYKVELVCEDSKLSNVISAMKKAHPYEEPAYQIISFTT